MNPSYSVVYFNNCHNRDHVGLFGSGAFFDLESAGRQGNQARDLRQAQLCIVVERGVDDQLTFGWYSFEHEFLLPSDTASLNGPASRVFFGTFLASETLPKAKAARSLRYSAFFKKTGHLKNGSVFSARLPSRIVPADALLTRSDETGFATNEGSGGGFGMPKENKLVEMAAIRMVWRSYEQKGWLVRSVERERYGFDLICTGSDATENVEVKGIGGTVQRFIITAREIREAQVNSRFVLILVTSALSAAPTLWRYSGSELKTKFELSPIQCFATLK